jgi:uncharacterized protein (DUF58 family)
MDSFKPSLFRSKTRAAIAARVQRWARVRQGEDSAPLTLLARRIYILPTRTGLAAGVLLFVMLLAGTNYNNSLALLLCFMLCGIALVSMYECHRTLAGLRLVDARAADTFSGRDGEILLTFENADSRTRSALQVRHADHAAAEFELKPGEIRPVAVLFRAGPRGRQRIDRLKLWTEAPLGLFGAWSWLYLPLEIVVYPAPSGTRALPVRRATPQAGSQRHSEVGEEEWAGLREFQHSDSPRRVAWKIYARGSPLMVAQYHAPASSERSLDLGALPGSNLEQKLSQLALWVLECERRGERYELRLAALTIAVSHGAAQRRACLMALAQYGL